MIVPSKYISFENSIIFKMLTLLEHQGSPILIKDLYFKFEEHFAALDEFLYSLDVLYALEAINVNFEEGSVVYAQRN